MWWKGGLGHDRARCGGWVVCVGKTLYNVKAMYLAIGKLFVYIYLCIVAGYLLMVEPFGHLLDQCY